jgi:hypothetical protein
MRCGTIVAGFNSIGGVDTLKGTGPNQNSILAQTGDYISLAYAIEPLLIDLISGNLSQWDRLIESGRNTTLGYTYEAEEKSLVKFWNRYAKQ